VKSIITLLLGLALAGTTYPQNYPSMLPSTQKINFASADGSPLFTGQTAYATVVFTVTHGTINFKQTSPLCMPRPASVSGSASGSIFTISNGTTVGLQKNTIVTLTGSSQSTQQSVISYVSNTSITFDSPITGDPTIASWTPSEYVVECDDINIQPGSAGSYQEGSQFPITFSLLGDGDDSRCDINSPNRGYPDGCEGILQIKVPNSPNVITIDYSYQSANPDPQIKIIQPVFQPTELGESSEAEAEIYNPGDVPLILTYGKSTNAAFIVAPDQCPNPLPPQQSCGINITFRPTQSAQNSGYFPITDNDTNPDAPTTVRMSGVGTIL